MSKSKSRRSSRSTAGSVRSAANGDVKQTSAANKTPVKSTVSASETTASAPTTTAAKQGSTANASIKPLSTPGKAQTRDAAKYERRQAERQRLYLAQRRARRNRFFTWTAAVLLVALIGGLGYWIYESHLPTAKAATSAAAFQEPIFDSSYPPVDNVYCDQLEQVSSHIHAHVSIYIDGKLSNIPQFVGIPQDGSGNATCFYWLHTHDTSGVIHMEAPVNETFTFGQFLTEWDQQFNSLGFPPQLLLKSGWTVWVNGKPYKGTIDSIPMTAHALITIAYNSPNTKPDTTYAWNGL